jgi:hypothetical protein
VSTNLRRALGLLGVLLAAAAGPAVALEQWSVFCDPSTIAAFALDDENETLWAGGPGGLYRLDVASGALTAVTTAEGLAGIEVADLLMLDGELWVATAKEGLQRYRPGAAEPWFRFQTFPQGMAADALRCLAADPDEGLWYGSTAGYGLIRNGEHQDLWNELHGLANSDVRSLAFLGDTLLVGTAAGLYRMDDPGENPALVPGLPAAPIAAVAVAADSVWLLSEGRIYGNALSSSEVWPQLTLPAGTLTATALDAAGDSLVAVLTVSGTDSANDRTWRYAPGIGWTDLSAGMPSGAAAGSSNLLYDALLATRDGGCWMGGAIQDGLGPGILHRDGSGWEHIPPDGFPLGREFNAMALGPAGRLWAMSTIGGAAHAGGEWTRYPSEASFSFMPRFGLDVLEDSQGWVWFNRFGTGAAPRGAFGRIELATGTHELVSPTGNAILRMLEDPAGNRWFARDALDGALRGGIDVYTPADELHSFDSSDGLPGNTVDNLAILSATRVAMLFRGAGLHIWDHAGTLAALGDDQWWSVGAGIEDASGLLSSDTLFEALAAAVDGGLWVGQSNGLVRVLPTSTGYRARAQLGQKTSFSDGLLGLDVKDLASAPDGSVWVGTPLGLSQVRLDIETEGGAELLRWTVQSWTNEAGREQAGTELYGPEVLAPLPSPDVFRVAVNPAGDTVWVATSYGVARLVLQPDPPVTGAALAGAWLYPNPARLALGHEVVHLGGLAVAAEVSVYNLEGQLVREVGAVEPGGVAWDLKTRFGNRAVSGVYVMRLELQGETVLRELVVVR